MGQSYQGFDFFYPGMPRSSFGHTTSAIAVTPQELENSNLIFLESVCN